MSRNPTGFKLFDEGMDVRESTPTHTQIQLEAAIYSAHGLLKVGLIEQATDLLTAFLPKEVNG